MASSGKTSRIPPRRLNSPATSTTSTRLIAWPTSHRASSSTAIVSPTRIVLELFARASGRGRGCKRAWIGATTTRGGSAPASRFATWMRRPNSSSVGRGADSEASSGEDRGRDGRSQAGKSSVFRPENVETSPAKSSASPAWARTIRRVVGEWRPRAAAARGDADPQAPSIVAPRPFFRDARTSANPGAVWMIRVRSFSALTGAATVAEVFLMSASPVSPVVPTIRDPSLSHFRSF